MNHDGLLAFGGCDKNMPGCVMAMARLNIPSVFVYGGSILPGRRRRTARTWTSSPSSRRSGSSRRARSTQKTLHKVECESCPGHGSCGGMYTANTMASAIEAMGLSPALRREQPGRHGREGARGVPRRAGGRAVHREEHPPARPHHPQEPGERLHLRARPRRLDERGAAPHGHRPRGRRAVDARRLRPPRREGAAPRGPEAGRQVRHVRSVPRRRHARGDEGAARQGLPARRLPDRDGQDASRRTSRTCRACSRSRRRWCCPSRSRCSTTASSSS